MNQSACNNKGFTLLEILLAFFIFSLIIGIIYSSYSGSFTTVNKTESRMEMYHKAAIAMDRISEDLQGAYISLQSPTDSTTESSGTTRFIGENNEIGGSEADTISFFSRIPPLFENDVKSTTGQVISYEVKEGEFEDELILLRSEHGEFIEPADEREGLPLCDGLQAVKFTFIDAEGEEHKDWDSDSEDFAGSLPSMVTVTLVFLNRDNPDAPQVFETGVALPAQSMPELQNGANGGNDTTGDNNSDNPRQIVIGEIGSIFHAMSLEDAI